MASADRAIKEFLWTNMYRHPRVIGVMENAEVVVRELFARFFVSPQDMPPDWAQGLDPRRRGRARAPRRGFHRRNDRRLRAGRARAAVSESLT